MEIGEVIRKILPEFTVIGKEGKGLASEGGSWVPTLWELATEHFEDLAEVAGDVDIEPVQLWGLMSDEISWLDPWKETGRYLAGMQLPPEVETPEGWTRWVIPEMEYLVVKTNEANLETMTQKMFEEILPQQGVALVAAIQEHYLPEFTAGEVELYFPINIL